MKKIAYILIAILPLTLGACSKFTEITPKGSNLLTKVSDLDLLLNFNFGQVAYFKFDDVNTIINDNYPYAKNILSIIAGTKASLDYAQVTYDESVDRKTLTTSDARYTGLYAMIVNIDNSILAKVDAASGDQALAGRIKAEALVQRAYYHYILVNLHAKAYDPATASTDGGIAYVTDIDVSKVKAKLTVAEVYKRMLDDVNAALALNTLPQTPSNNMRPGLAFAYAVKARILLAMRDYPNALEAANASLAINSNIEDQRLLLATGFSAGVSRAPMTATDNLFYAAFANSGPALWSFSTEFAAKYFEPGTIINNSLPSGVFYPGNNPISGVPASKIWFAQTYATNGAGMTTSDTYYAKAECLARRAQGSDLADATAIVNLFRQRRINPASYQPLPNATGTQQAMSYIMMASRLEGIGSYRNFFNVKRWNSEQAYQQTITRTVNGTTYTLSPSSSLYMFPFPQDATGFNPTLTDNY
jgi:tetratricopeptide (TPR) repeat protein